MNENTFWEIIEALEWDGDYEKCSLILMSLIQDETIKHPQDFYYLYDSLVKKINKETMRRLDSGKEAFEDFVHYGADDCHFMDLPSEIIGRGKEEFTKYLKGNYRIPYEPRECMSYMFHGLEDEEIITLESSPNSVRFIIED